MESEKKRSGKVSDTMSGKKKCKEQKGMQTIAAMFKRQKMAAMPEKKTEPDEEVIIVEASIDSQPNKQERNKLSLKRKSTTVELRTHTSASKSAEKTCVSNSGIPQKDEPTSASEMNPTAKVLNRKKESVLKSSKNIPLKNRLSLRRKKLKIDESVVMAVEEPPTCCSVTDSLQSQHKNGIDMEKTLNEDSNSNVTEERVDREDMSNERIHNVKSNITRKSKNIKSGDESHEVADNDTAKVDDALTKRKREDELSDKMDEAVTKEDETADEIQYVPYYLQNFSNIIHTVLSDNDNVQLFSEQDLRYVAIFDELEETAQKLYVRLFCRKLAWLPVNKLKYLEISSDLTDIVHQLVSKDFLITDEKLEDLQETLTFLPAPDLKSLAKSFHVKCTGLIKLQIIKNLLEKSRHSTVSSMFKMAGGGMQQTMMKRAKTILGRCIKLSGDPRGVFIRLLMLYSLVNTATDEESGSGGQSQIFQMLLVNMGKVVYPTYTISKKTAIFKNRESVVELEKALQYETNLNIHLERNEYQEAYDLYQEIRSHWGKLETINFEWDKNLPNFLRRYTAGHVYTRLLRYGVDIIQRRKDYAQAVELLRQLLSTDIYGADHRGYYWDRLALNLEIHLKSTKQSLEAVESGLADPNVKGSFRFSLYQRAVKICKSAKWKSYMTRFYHDEVREAPECYVEGKVLAHTVPGARYKFMLEDEEETEPGDVTLCSVEELALQYYRHNGFPQGVHAEGSIIGVLYCLFFWDIIFMDVPDTFHSPFQTCPLDTDTDMFYVHRQKALEEELLKIKNSTDEEIQSIITSTWEKENGKMCSKMNWEKFSLEQLQGLVACMRGHVIAGILERYVKDPRHTRSGFPDLTVWNVEKKTFKISEVKGPGDHLSNKQILWLDYLLKLGVDAEVCYVRAVGAKRLKRACD